MMFKPCASCANDPWTPTLCATCRHNSAAIDRLRGALRTALSGWERVASAGDRPGDRQKIAILRQDLGL